MAEWISVKDRLPRYGQLVLAFDRVEGCVSIMSFDPEEGGLLEGWYTDSGWYREADDVRYWMPLPEPPGEEAEK